MSEPFFSRWSRLKRQTTQETPTTDAAAAPQVVASDTAAAEPGQRGLSGQRGADGVPGVAPAQAVSPSGIPLDTLHVPVPDLNALTSDSDFAPFMQRQVSEAVRRQALRTLFADPHFNVMDGLDVYIDDYSISDPIPPEMLAGLEQTKRLFGLTASGEEAAEGSPLTDSAETRAPADPATSLPSVAARDADTGLAAQASEDAAAPVEVAAREVDCDNLSIDGQIVAPGDGKSV